MQRKQEWNQYINRIRENRLVRIAREKSLNGKQSIDQPSKSWRGNLNLDKKHRTIKERIKPPVSVLPRYLYTSKDKTMPLI